MSPIGDDWRFCPRCGATLELRISGDAPRPTCERCGFVFFANMGVGVAAVIDDSAGRVLLVQRADGQFGAGLWCLPCGYVEWGEPVENAAVRETYEETGLTVDLGGLVGVYSYPATPVVIVVYEARVTGGTLTPCHENDLVEWVGRNAIPWEELAFPSTAAALRDFLAGR